MSNLAVLLAVGVFCIAFVIWEACKDFWTKRGEYWAEKALENEQKEGK